MWVTLCPMAGVVEGFRWVLLGKENIDFGVIVMSTVIGLALLLSGTLYFKQVEHTFSDVV